jgi:hypothetical protein
MVSRGATCKLARSGGGGGGGGGGRCERNVVGYG